MREAARTHLERVSALPVVRSCKDERSPGTEKRTLVLSSSVRLCGPGRFHDIGGANRGAAFIEKRDFRRENRVVAKEAFFRGVRPFYFIKSIRFFAVSAAKKRSGQRRSKRGSRTPLTPESGPGGGCAAAIQIEQRFRNRRKICFRQGETPHFPYIR